MMRVGQIEAIDCGYFLGQLRVFAISSSSRDSDVTIEIRLE
jgi:hypothetical protein